MKAAPVKRASSSNPSSPKSGSPSASKEKANKTKPMVEDGAVKNEDAPLAEKAGGDAAGAEPESAAETKPSSSGEEGGPSGTAV